jgi:hypothetical protein
MTARRFSKVPIVSTVTALALCGVTTVFLSCAESPGNGGAGGGGGGNTGGAGGAGGQPPVSCTPGEDNVCFKDGQAQGKMTGWGWVALGALDILADPTCDTDNHAITSANACTTTTNWTSADSGLCITGTIPALPAEPYQSDYDNNWGIQIGVNTSEPPGTTLGKDYTSIAITVTGKPSTGLRAELHVKGEPAGQTYCSDMASGKVITLTSFNRECWNGATADKAKDLTTDSIKNIDKVGVQVSSTQSEISVQNLCIVGIAFK